MLYVIHKANHPELAYRGGQGPIVHLKADLHEVVRWARSRNRRWAFTSSNAASWYSIDHCSLDRLDQIDWQAVKAKDWRDRREGKQAEFLVERFLPWGLVRKIGVNSEAVRRRTIKIVRRRTGRPAIELRPDWYY